MNIGIIGGGSIGLLFAFFLNQHHHVTLYTKSFDQKDKILSDGLYYKQGDKTDHIQMAALHVSEWENRHEDITIICVKQYQLKTIMPILEKRKSISLLFLQNGMGHLPFLEHAEAERIYVGSVEHGAYREAVNVVSHLGKGSTKLAVFRGQADPLLEMIVPFKKSFPFMVEDNYLEMLQKKLIVNSVINPLTAVLKVPNGKLISNPFYFEIFNLLFKEVITILGIEKENEYYENLIKICHNTSENKSSMLKDIEENNPTEIDAILGYLLKEANHNLIKAPLVQTFYDFIKGHEFGREET